MARAVHTSLFATAAAAAATAITGTAGAQGPGVAADQPAAPTDSQATTPAPAPTSPVTTTPEGTTDLGTIDVEVGKPPASKKQTEAEKRREAARQFLQENRDARARLIQQQGAAGTSPFSGLSDPLSTPLTTVPDAVLEGFRIPTFLLPIYQAAGTEYGIRWEILAAINEIETDYGRNLSVSSAGAMGWMQFMPGTWETYGTDANRDGEKDPYNPVDAIFSAARYLKASGASESIERAIFSYNHADWYVADVIKRAKELAALPPDLVGALTGLTMGRAPVTGPTNYAGAYNFDKAGKAGVAEPVSSGTRRSTRIYAQSGAGAVAVQDGQVEEIGKNRRLGNFVRLRDGYGNLYTYAHLDSLATHHVVPRGDEAASAPVNSESPATPAAASSAPATAPSGGRSTPATKERLFAEPARPGARSAGGDRQINNGAGGQAAAAPGPRPSAVDNGELGRYLAPPYSLRRDQVALLPMRRGSRVIAGTILGRVGAASQAWPSKDTAADANPHVYFEIRPAGEGAPRIDPTPILDGWRLLASTNVYRASNPMLRGGRAATIGQILLMSKEALERRVLANRRLEIYECGRQDIRAGSIDRRVLAAMEFLTARGMKLGITSLLCGHGYYTASGNVSHHSSGNAMDIATINGTPIMGNQGAGSITDRAVRELLTLQGSMKPAQIITLMQYAGTDNTYAMGDHADHIHVGWQPGASAGAAGAGGKVKPAAVLKPGQWKKLVGRLDRIENPAVPVNPSRYSIKVRVKPRTR